MNLDIFHYPRCGTCREAVKWLEGQGWTLNKIDIVEHTPSAAVLADLIERSGLDVRKFFNVSGNVYKEQNMKDKLPGLSREEQIALLASNGMLIKRPIVTDGQRVTVGFKASDFGQVW